MVTDGRILLRLGVPQDQEFFDLDHLPFEASYAVPANFIEASKPTNHIGTCVACRPDDQVHSVPTNNNALTLEAMEPARTRQDAIDFVRRARDLIEVRFQS